MRRADQVSGVLLLVFGLWFAVAAWRQYPYWTSTGPGSGFLPLWLGLTMTVLAAMLFVAATRRPHTGAWLPGGRALVRLVVVIVATAAFVWLVPVLGMTLGTFLFLIGLLRFLEGHGWPATVGVALATAAANWLVFIRWLNVPFPPGVLGF